MSAPSNANAAPLVGVVLEEQIDISVDQVCSLCRVERTQIVHLVEEGVIDPMQPSSAAAQWRFSGEAMARARRAVRLQRELELNPAAAALVLDLLDEVAALREALRR
jgi:chaperone modulatory protein CbpM